MVGVCRDCDGCLPKIIKGIGDDSMHWTIATIACETGLSPTELMNLEPRMLFTIQRYLVGKATARSKRR